MTREEFSKIVAAMKAVYTDPKFLPDTYAIGVWYGFLKDMSNAQCQAAVSRYVATHRFAPTIADIREAAVDNRQTDNGISVMEAWSLVRTALRNSGYGSQEEFARLPKTAQKAVGSPENLREMSQLDVDQVETVEQSHFIRAYNAALMQERDDAKIPPATKRLIEMVREKTRLLEDGK